MNKIKIWEDVVLNKNALHDIKIIHIADIHFNINTKKKKLDSLSSCINLEKPDYVIITGDIIDTGDIVLNKEKIKDLIDFFKSIAKYSKVLVSLGNHDIRKDSYAFFISLDEINNVFVLDNKSYEDQFVFISGVTLPVNYYYNEINHESILILNNYLDKYCKLIKNLCDDRVKIALIHSPIKLEKMEVLNKLSEFDLILSGHTHDGLVPDILKCLFRGNWGIVSPYKVLFPKIARGKLIKEVGKKKITIIITGGVTKLSLVSAKWLSNCNFIYNIGVNRIIITKKEVGNNE